MPGATWMAADSDAWRPSIRSRDVVDSCVSLRLPDRLVVAGVDDEISVVLASQKGAGISLCVSLKAGLVVVVVDDEVAIVFHDAIAPAPPLSLKEFVSVAQIAFS